MLSKNELGFDKKIHLLMPTYNRAKILPNTLKMIMEQNASPDLWHLTVVDNLSNDRTLELLQEYSEKYPNFDYEINEKNLGLFGNLNRCMNLARTDKYMIIHSDDNVKRNLVSRALKAIDDFPDAGMIFGPSGVYFSKTGASLERWHPSASLTYFDREISSRQFMAELMTCGSNFIFAPTVIYNKKLFTANLRYDECYKYSSDFKLWLDVASSGMSIGYYSEPLINCNVHEDRLSNENAKLMRLEYLNICKKYLLKLKLAPTLHDLPPNALSAIWVKLLLYEVAVRLNINLSFKLRRIVAVFFEKLSLRV
jgi:glycosyltransferase involved in cell wall biosynthesis